MAKVIIDLTDEEIDEIARLFSELWEEEKK